MCEPASFVVTKTNVYFSTTSNSHDQIRVGNKLRDNEDSVNVELIPGHHGYGSEPTTWELHVDQDEVPTWFKKKETEARVRDLLPEWLKYHGCQQGQGRNNERLKGGFRVSQWSGECTEQISDSCSVQHALRRAIQISGDGSVQAALNIAQQTANDNSYQIAQEHSVQNAAKWATQLAGYRAVQTAGNNALQVSGNASIQLAGYESLQKTGDRSYQCADANTLQVTRWRDGAKLRTATRIVTFDTSGRWFYVEKGVWTAATESQVDEARRLNMSVIEH